MTTIRKHCCDLMAEFIADPKIPVYYSPILREYALDRLDTKSVQQDIFYCSWCGTKLPQSLRDIFFDILEEEYELEADMDILENKNLPEEFRSDAWWKKRSL